MIAHIAKRIIFVLVGYLAALTASTIFLWSLASLVAYLWFQLRVSSGPTGLPPEIEFLILLLAVSIAFSVLPAAAFILVAEILKWRHLWIYLLGALLIATLIMLMTSDWPVHILDWTIPASTIVSSLLAGVVYWFIAGCHAGKSEKESA